MVVEINECFANTVQCCEFSVQSLTKQNELSSEGAEATPTGKIIFKFIVSKNFPNSNRHRVFYTESTTAKKNKIELLKYGVK